MTLRILFAGSRKLGQVKYGRDLAADRAIIEAALADALGLSTVGNPVLVHGKAPGGDSIADEAWESWRADGLGLYLAKPERYRAEDFATPLVRNQHMVDLGATRCVAWALDWASGTGNCARAARRAGIPVVDLGVPTGAGERR